MPTQAELKKQLATQAAEIKERDAAPRRTIRQLLEDPVMQREIAKAIPTAMTPDRFARLVLTCVSSTPMLQECDPLSLLAGAMQFAQLGLEPGTSLGHGWLLPFRDKGVPKVQVVIGYRGMIELALRSGRVSSIEAREVCENDHWDWCYGLDDKLEHRPVLTDRGEIIAYYVIVRYVNGGRYWRVIPPEQIEEHRQRSKSPNSPAWRDDHLTMALKTCVRIASPMLSLTAEAASGITADESTLSFEDMVAGRPAVIETQAAPELMEQPAIEVESSAAAPPDVSVCETCGTAGGEHDAGCPDAPF